MQKPSKLSKHGQRTLNGDNDGKPLGLINGQLSVYHNYSRAVVCDSIG